MSGKHEISETDILPMDEYARNRREHRERVMAIKRNRRMEVGPFATLYFENYDTMWHQVHEMLHIEKGGSEQLAGELDAYNPLVPKGSELVATLMLEISDPERRKLILQELGGVETTVRLKFGDYSVTAAAEADVDRTTADGKASSVHFLHFRLSDEECEAFKKPDDDVIVVFDHPNYRHMAVMPMPVREALASDLD